MNDEWATPPEIFDPLNKLFKFDLDVCATYENRKVHHYLGSAPTAIYGDYNCRVAQDGLAWGWGNNVCYMNPPYSRGNINKWVAKAAQEARKGATVVGLVRADPTAQWWQDSVHGEASEIWYPKKRVRFVGADASYPFPISVVVWREKVSSVLEVTG